MSHGPNRSNGGAWLALAILIVVVMLLLATLGCTGMIKDRTMKAEQDQDCVCECDCKAICAECSESDFGFKADGG